MPVRPWSNISDALEQYARIKTAAALPGSSYIVELVSMSNHTTALPFALRNVIETTSMRAAGAIVTTWSCSRIEQISDALNRGWGELGISIRAGGILQGFNVASPNLSIAGRSEVCSYVSADIYPPITSPESFVLMNTTGVQTLIVSEVSPPGYFKVTLPVPPAEGEEVRVDCSDVAGARGLQIRPTSVSFYGPSPALEQISSALPLYGVVQTVSNASMHASRIAPRAGSIRCTVRSHVLLTSEISGLNLISQYAQYAVTSWEIPADLGLSIPVPFVWLPAKLPMIEDAIVEVAGSGLRSAWAQTVYPDELTQLLRDVDISAMDDKYFALVHTLWREDPLNTRIIASVARTVKTRMSPFHVTIAHILGGDVNITLVAEGFSTNSGQGTFLPGARVTIGPFECPIQWVDPSGQLLRFTAPPIERVCPGYRPCQVILSISNPIPAISSIRGLATARDADLLRDLEKFSSGLEAEISIPPFLSGVGSRPLAALAGWANAVSMNFSAGYSTFLELTAASDVSAVASGFIYSRDCPPMDFDLNLTRCGDISLALNEPRPRCPFRPENTSLCTLCPYGAICPTQAFAFPLPGYWSSHPSSQYVMACRTPSSRCLGFDPVLGRSACGSGYMGFACQSCMSGYYPAFGACERCELGTPAMLVVRRIGFFALGLVVASMVVFAIVFAVNKRVGSDLHDSVRRVVMFVTASIFILQIISQATRALRSSAPPMLRSMFKALEVLQFSSIAPPPECLQKAHPFQEYLINYGHCLLLILINLLANIDCSTIRRGRCKRGNPHSANASSSSAQTRDKDKPDFASSCRLGRLCGRIRPHLRRMTFILLSLLFALTVNNTLAMLYCRTEYVTVARYAELDQSGIALRKTGFSAKNFLSIRSCELDPRGLGCEEILSWSQMHMRIRILDMNPSFVCYEGTHLQVVWLVYIVLLVYVLGYPVGSYIYLRRRIHAVMLRESDAGEWTAALVADRARQNRYVHEAQACWAHGVRYLRASLFKTAGRYRGGHEFQANGHRAVCTLSCFFLGSRGHREIRTANDIVDDNDDIRYDVATSPFVADVYRTSLFYQRHIDFACLSGLSFLLVFAQEHPRLQLSLTLVILVLHTASVLTGRPYTTEASFNHIVRICANFVAMMGAIVLFFSYIDNSARATVPAASKKLVPLSYFMLTLCIGLALLFVTSFFFTLVMGAKLDRERVLNRAKGLRMLVSPLSRSKSIVEEVQSSPDALKRAEISLDGTMVLTRGQRVHIIRPADNIISGIEASDNGPLYGRRIFVSPTTQERTSSTMSSDDWDTQGMECQANPLFVTADSGAFCPPHAGGHQISDW
jgi:hypothetical protein